MFFNLMNGYNMNVSFLHENVFFSAELPENWTDTRETILEGMTFNLRHLGMTLVDQPKGEDLSAAAVKRIVAMVRTGVKSCLLSKCCRHTVGRIILFILFISNLAF